MSRANFCASSQGSFVACSPKNRVGMTSLVLVKLNTHAWNRDRIIILMTSVVRMPLT